MNAIDGDLGANDDREPIEIVDVGGTISAHTSESAQPAEGDTVVGGTLELGPDGKFQPANIDSSDLSTDSAENLRRIIEATGSFDTLPPDTGHGVDELNQE